METPSSATQVHRIDLIRSEICRFLDHEDLKSYALASHSTFEDAMKRLWRSSRLRRLNRLFRMGLRLKRFDLYMDCIRQIIVQHDIFPEKGSDILGIGWDLERLLPIAVQRNGDGRFEFSGVEYLPKLKLLDIKSCSSELLGYSDGDVRADVGEVHQIGARTVRVRSRYRQSELLLCWANALVDIHSDTSYIESLRLSWWTETPEETNEVYQDVIGALLEEIRDASPSEQQGSRLRRLECFTLKEEISCKDLMEILSLLPQLKELQVILRKMGDKEPPLDGDAFALYLAKKPVELESLRIRGAPLEWLPYLRRCAQVHLDIGVAVKSSKLYDDLRALPPIQWVNLDDAGPAYLGLILPRVDYDWQADDLISFIEGAKSDHTAIQASTYEAPLGSDMSDRDQSSDSDFDSDDEGYGITTIGPRQDPSKKWIRIIRRGVTAPRRTRRA